MTIDEKEIRELITTWMAATKSGDTETVLSLMADDVLFLLPGRPPMTKPAFAAAATLQSRPGAPTVEGVSEIQEITVLGDWAFMWTKLKVTITPPDGAKPIVRAGPTLSILKKQRGKWVVARDANMLAPVAESAP